MVSKISEADRADIISTFSTAVEAGASKSVLDSIRTELRKKYCPNKYSAQQVDAVCSHVIIQRSKKLRALLENANVPVTSSAESSITEDATPEISLESAEPYAIEQTGLKNNEPQNDNGMISRKMGYRNEGTGTEDENIGVVVTDQTSITGEHVDYDNETKNRWREEWRKYLESNTDPTKRAQMKVLCLPGKKCLEIPMYLAMGFDPKNIVGVEGGDNEARDEFLRNAAQYGIDAQVGRLEKLLIDDHEPFDVISLDFHGPISELATVIMQRILPAEKAVIMVNLLKRRENGTVQQALSLMKEHYDGGYEEVYRRFSQEINAQFSGTAEEKYRELYRRLHEHYADAKPENLDEARDTYGHKITIQSVGVRKMDRWMLKDDFSINFLPPNDRDVPDPVFHFRNIFGNAFARTVSQLFAELFCKFKFDRSHCTLDAVTTAEFMIDTVVSRSHITDLRKISYKSESKQRAPFYTDMAVVETPMAHYRLLRETAQFFKDVTVEIMSNTESVIEGEKDFGLWLRTRDGAIAQPGRTVSKADQIIAIFDNRTIASIKIGQFMKDFAKHQQFKAHIKEKRFEIDKLEREVMVSRD